MMYQRRDKFFGMEIDDKSTFITTVELWRPSSAEMGEMYGYHMIGGRDVVSTGRGQCMAKLTKVKTDQCPT